MSRADVGARSAPERRRLRGQLASRRSRARFRRARASSRRGTGSRCGDPPTHVRLVGVERVGQHARRAGRQRERIVVPLERRERARGRRTTRAARRHRRTATSIQPISGDGAPGVTGAPSACARSCPPRQWPITGNVRVHRVAQQRVERRDPRQRVVDAHRAAHHARCRRTPAASAGTAAPSSSATSSPRQAVRVEPVGEIRRAFGRREAEDGDGAHGSGAGGECRKVGGGARGHGVRPERVGRPTLHSARDPRVRGVVVDRLEVLRLDDEPVDRVRRPAAAPRRRAPGPRRSAGCRTRAP